ncbi:TPA: hypothetical protein EYH33_05290 [Candidatus Bipolaricaulota bacterium]|nr:hypothetical protein [Candidatus Bipolaricaulota bacterium]
MGAIARAAYTEILGFPLVFWAGILTYISVGAAFSLMALGRRSPGRFRWHRRLGRVAFLLATLHALLGISAYLG